MDPREPWGLFLEALAFNLAAAFLGAAVAIGTLYLNDITMTVAEWVLSALCTVLLAVVFALLEVDE